MIWIGPIIHDLVDSGVNLHRSQLLGESVVETTWPQIQSHLRHPLSELLNPATENVHKRCMPVSPSCRNCWMTYAGVQLAESLLRHLVTLGRLGNEVVTGERGARQRCSLGRTTSFATPSSI
jgi:hypothetical protein